MQTIVERRERGSTGPLRDGRGGLRGLVKKDRHLHPTRCRLGRYIRQFREPLCIILAVGGCAPLWEDDALLKISMLRDAILWWSRCSQLRKRRVERLRGRCCVIAGLL